MKAQILIILITVAICIPIFILLRTHKGNEVSFRGVVIGKSYKPDTRGTNIGIGAAANGQMVTTVSSSGSPESFHVIILLENGELMKLKNEGLYTYLYERDSVIVKCREVLNRHDEVIKHEYIDANKIK
jgi:hypothetical protein